MIFKSKKIIELERQVSDLKHDIKEKDKEIAALKGKLSGERHCSQLCQRCVHAIPYPVWNALTGTYTGYMCELDNKCKDYNGKD